MFNTLTNVRGTAPRQQRYTYVELQYKYECQAPAGALELTLPAGGRGQLAHKHYSIPCLLKPLLHFYCKRLFLPLQENSQHTLFSLFYNMCAIKSPQAQPVSMSDLHRKNVHVQNLLFHPALKIRTDRCSLQAACTLLYKRSKIAARSLLPLGGWSPP